MKKLIKTALLKTLPIFGGYLVLGFGFGVILTKSGYSFLWAPAMSVFMYAGTMQYVSVDLLVSQASLLTCALTTLMVNARHLFYGISIIDLYRGAGGLKPYMMFALTAETYSLVCTGEVPEGLDRHKYYFTVSLLNHLYWIAGGMLGALIGTTVNFNSAGIDFSMTAIFITVFIDQWKSTKNHAPALIGAIGALVCLMIFGSENFLIPSMLLILAILFFARRALEKGAYA